MKQLYYNNIINYIEGVVQQQKPVLREAKKFSYKSIETKYINKKFNLYYAKKKKKKGKMIKKNTRINYYSQICSLIYLIL